MRIGVDNVSIQRVSKLSKGFAKRFLSPREYRVYTSLPEARRDAYLASRFAAKEAYVKASGRKGIRYSSVETLDDEEGRPHLYVEGREVGAISLTHDVIATAVVALEG